MSVPAWLQEEEDDMYQFDSQPSTGRASYQPTPPPAKPGGNPISSIPGANNSMTSQPAHAAWLSDSANQRFNEGSATAPQPPLTGAFASPGNRQFQVLTPGRDNSKDNSNTKRAPPTKKFAPFASTEEDEDDEEEEGNIVMIATPPPAPVSSSNKPHQRQGGSRDSHRDSFNTGDDLSFSDGGVTPVDTGSVKEKKDKKKNKHINGELIDVELKSGGDGTAPQGLLRRLEKTAKKPKKERKEKDEAKIAKKEKKIARPRPTRPTVTVGGTVSPGGTFITEGSVPGEAAAIGVGIGIEDQGKEVDLSVIPELSAEDRAEFKAMIQFTSLEAVSKLRSSKFQHRAMGIQDLTQTIVEKIGTKPTQAIAMAFTMWQVTINDKVVQVFTNTCESICTVSNSVSFVDEDTLAELHPTIQTLGIKLRDSNARTKMAATSALEALAGVKSVGPVFIVNEVCDSSAPTVGASTSQPDLGGEESGGQSQAMAAAAGNFESWKAILARLEFLSEISKIHGNRLITKCKEPMIAQTVLGLKCTNSKVRKTSIDFAIRLYKVIGAFEMERHLGDVSPAVMKVLKEALEGADVLGGVDAGQADRQEDEDMASFEAEGIQLSEELQTIIEQWTKETGLRSVKCLFCPRWKIRERFLDRLHTMVRNTLTVAQGGPEEAKNFDPSRLFKVRSDTVKVVLGSMCEKALSDSVPNVLQAAQLLTKTTVTLMEKVATKEFFATFAQGLIAPLVKQAGLSSNSEDICEQILIQSFAKHPKVGPHAIYSSICDATSTGVVISKISVKILVPRLDLLCALIDAHGFDGPKSTSLDEDQVMTYTMKAFEHPQQKVRMAAVGTIISVYKKAGNVIQPYLSQLKGALLDDLKTKIAGIARKERSSTAPIQRLAGIVEPLGDGPLGDAVLGSSPQRPSTMELPVRSSNRTGEDPSMREKITSWHRKKGEVKKGDMETLDDVEDDDDTNSDADDAMDNAPVLHKNITAERSNGVIRPGAAGKNRLVFS